MELITDSSACTAFATAGLAFQLLSLDARLSLGEDAR